MGEGGEVFEEKDGKKSIGVMPPGKINGMRKVRGGGGLNTNPVQIRECGGGGAYIVSPKEDLQGGENFFGGVKTSKKSLVGVVLGGNLWGVGEGPDASVLGKKQDVKNFELRAPQNVMGITFQG